LYTGATDGFEDMGRDIIARKGGKFFVIQCKYWSSEKVIREKHIFQLFGSTMEYSFRFGEAENISRPSLFRNPIQTIGVEAFLYTSRKLSEEAKVVAGKLGISFFENASISDYPLVKCNIATRGWEKIYHLPFDQQYDRTKINTELGEKFVYTVEEAERMGFRRAWRWKGDESSPQ
jgi:hypothetical protein